MEKRRRSVEHSVKLTQSIRTKFIFIMILMMGLVLFGIWAMNYTMLSPYYEYSKASMLAESFYDAQSVLNIQGSVDDDSGELTAESRLKLEIIEESSSVNLFLFQLGEFLGQTVYRFEYPDVTQEQKARIILRVQEYLSEGQIAESAFHKEGRKLVREKEEYVIFKVYDKRMSSYYLELIGVLDTGSFIYLRTNYQSMNESIATFNRFIGYAGGSIFVVGIILMIFIGNNFARPIVQIADIAQRISDLDFEVKYPVTTQDEIGVLGGCINTLSENLERTISELKTANNELQKDIERKVQIDEMRKEFLSNVSHELKTPIALIQGYAEGLQDNINEDKESREFYCEVIIDEAKKMNKMVKKLLSLNQIESGNDQVAFERFDIVNLIQNVIQSAGILAEKKEAVITFDKQCDSAFVWADEYMVEEVVTNYISNAINHVDFEKKIEVTLEKYENVVKIRVFNTGKQIPEEELDKVWIKFYKVDKARTREYGGSGIGLSIVKAIMEALNQKYGVVNHDDGVEFWFELDCRN